MLGKNPVTIKTQRPRRSFIFTPGLKPEMFPKALASGTDIVCIELEDGIAYHWRNRYSAKADMVGLGFFERGSAQVPLEEESTQDAGVKTVDELAV